MNIYTKKKKQCRHERNKIEHLSTEAFWWSLPDFNLPVWSGWSLIFELSSQHDFFSSLRLQEQRLHCLQQQETCEQERLQQLRENAHNQEAKLRRVRALRGQVEQKRLSNSKLGRCSGSAEAYLLRLLKLFFWSWSHTFCPRKMFVLKNTKMPCQHFYDTVCVCKSVSFLLMH